MILTNCLLYAALRLSIHFAGGHYQAKSCELQSGFKHFIAFFAFSQWSLFLYFNARTPTPSALHSSASELHLLDVLILPRGGLFVHNGYETSVVALYLLCCQ